MADCVQQGTQQEQQPVSGGLRVMICVDGSHSAESAFHYYVEKVHKPDNEVVIVHVAEFVISSSHLFVGAMGMGITVPTGSTTSTEGIVQEVLEKERKNTKKIETKFRQKCKDLGIRYNFLKLTDEGHGPGDVIVEAAQKHGADFIVTGTRGRGAIRRTILGSVSDYVLHHSHVPTLICPKLD